MTATQFSFLFPFCSVAQDLSRRVFVLQRVDWELFHQTFRAESAALVLVQEFFDCSLDSLVLHGQGTNLRRRSLPDLIRSRYFRPYRG